MAGKQNNKFMQMPDYIIRYTNVFLLRVLGIIFLLLIPGHLVSQVYINEIMASNSTVLSDPDYGNYCDWIELYNANEEAVDFAGLYLVDTLPAIVLWEFPVDTTGTSSHFDLDDIEDVTVYPVPTNGPLFVKFNEKLSGRNLQVRVYVCSMTGKIISATQHHTSELISLSLQDLPEGLYVVRIITEEGVFVKRVMLY